MDQHVSDERIMERLARGDESALGELMKRWAGAITCFIDRMCGSLHATDDIHQEVWTRIFLYRKRYKPAKPFRAYIFKVTLNCCRTAIRRWRTGRPITTNVEENLTRIPIGGDPLPVDVMIANERRALLHQAITYLPERQRAVMLLYVLFDTDYRRIAKVLEMSAGTVRSNMHHALKKLRSTLNRMLQDSESQVDHERQII